MEIIFNKQVIEIVERLEKMSPSSNPLITTDVKRTFYLIDKIVTKKDAENDNLDCFFNTLLFIQNRVINFLENATEEDCIRAIKEIVEPMNDDFAKARCEMLARKAEQNK